MFSQLHVTVCQSSWALVNPCLWPPKLSLLSSVPHFLQNTLFWSRNHITPFPGSNHPKASQCNENSVHIAFSSALLPSLGLSLLTPLVLSSWPSSRPLQGWPICLECSSTTLQICASRPSLHYWDSHSMAIPSEKTVLKPDEVQDPPLPSITSPCSLYFLVNLSLLKMIVSANIYIYSFFYLVGRAGLYIGTWVPHCPDYCEMCTCVLACIFLMGKQWVAVWSGWQRCDHESHWWCDMGLFALFVSICLTEEAGCLASVYPHHVLVGHCKLFLV